MTLKLRKSVVLQSFVKIKPNDTIIFDQTSWSSFVDNAGTLNTLLSIVNLYFLIEYNKDQ